MSGLTDADLVRLREVLEWVARSDSYTAYDDFKDAFLPDTCSALLREVTAGRTLRAGLVYEDSWCVWCLVHVESNRGHYADCPVAAYDRAREGRE